MKKTASWDHMPQSRAFKNTRKIDNCDARPNMHSNGTGIIQQNRDYACLATHMWFCALVAQNPRKALAGHCLQNHNGPAHALG